MLHAKGSGKVSPGRRLWSWDLSEQKALTMQGEGRSVTGGAQLVQRPRDGDELGVSEERKEG